MMDVIYDTQHPGVLYGVNGASVKRSIDEGNTWNDIYDVKGTSTFIASIDKHDNTLYLCTTDNGILALDLTANGIMQTMTDVYSPTPYYDLMGRPVANPTRGIYIKDGR